MDSVLSRQQETAAALPTPVASRPLVGAVAALAITVPHALGLGLIAFASIAALMPIGALALWSAALPGAVMTLLVRARGVIYAPSSAVAMLFAGMLALIMQAGEAEGISAAQALAITGLFVALGFAFQWAIGRSGLAALSRFLPVSVTQGFSAGVGLSLVLTQLRQGLDAADWHWGPLLAWHLAIIIAVVLINLLLQRLWPRFPALLPALILVTLPALWLVPADLLRLAAQPGGLMLPPLPDWLGAPWWSVIQEAGIQLASLSLLLGVVNGLEVLVFHQELETGHGVRNVPDAVLRRESIWSGVCGLLGMIPASTSPSRSLMALRYTDGPGVRVGQLHALVLVGIALTGHLWLVWVPLAALAGTLIVAGARMVPRQLWLAPVSDMQRGIWWQSWLVAGLFAASGGAMALIAGLTVSTVVLLRTTANHVIRRMHLHGKLRSRHVRRADVDAWLAGRMSGVAVFELQGIVSFGVAALVVDQVRKHLHGHIHVILDASRVPSWDETGAIRMRALALDLDKQGIVLLISGVRGPYKEGLKPLHSFDDLDRALEWVEEQLLLDCPPHLLTDPEASCLGDLGGGMQDAARLDLEQRMSTTRYPAQATIIRSGDLDRTLMLVLEGTVALSTAEHPGQGLRLAVIGPGMVFGEMAFLNGIARTAYAHAGPGGAVVCSVEWSRFKDWTRAHPDGALEFMKELARMGIRRLGATSQELRAAME